MTPIRSYARPMLVAILAVAVVGTSGCSWLRSKFGGNRDYLESQQNRPLEVPPDLDTPPLRGAVEIPELPAGAAAAGGPTDVPGAAQAVAGIDSFTVADTLESTWRRLGLALGKIDGVTIDERAQLLNSYSVSYRGATLLLRAEAVGEGTRVVALGADGRPLTSGPATELLALLKARLG